MSIFIDRYRLVSVLIKYILKYKIQLEYIYTGNAWMTKSTDAITNNNSIHK